MVVVTHTAILELQSALVWGETLIRKTHQNLEKEAQRTAQAIAEINKRLISDAAQKTKT